MALPQFGTNSAKRKKRVYYEGTNTIYEGMSVCYNYDTTDNVLGWDKGNEVKGTTTAEGYQNEGKFLRVEDPATANLNWFAGVVACCKEVGKTGPAWIDIFVPNGAIIPVYTNANVSAGQSLGISDGSNILQASTGDDDPLGVATAEETYDRSETSGLVLAKLVHSGLPVSGTNAYFAPVRSVATGDAGGVRIDLTNLFTSTGETGPRTWGLYITGERASDYVLETAGCDDAAMRISISNYAANGEVYNFRGINVVASNRDGGIVGELNNIISVSAKQGSTNARIIGLQVDAQSLSADTADVMYGLDVALNREGGESTEEAGINIRTRGTIQTAINTALRISKDATDHGFINLLNIESDAVDVAAMSGNVTFDANDIKIPIVYNGDTYYLLASDLT